MSPDIIGTATISGAKLFLMKDLKLIYIFQDKLIIKFYFKVTKRNANLPFLSVNFPSVCSEITSKIVCNFLQVIVYTIHSFTCVTLWESPSKLSLTLPFYIPFFYLRHFVRISLKTFLNFTLLYTIILLASLCENLPQIFPQL